MACSGLHSGATPKLQACSKTLFYGAFSKLFYYGGEGGIPVKVAIFSFKIKELEGQPSHPPSVMVVIQSSSIFRRDFLD